MPYSGGSELVYYKWKRYLYNSIELIPIELKGRGRRFDESFCKNLEEAVEDILESIKKKIGHNDYAIYGHSMGGLLAYELYYKICENGIKSPSHLFFSGYRAPNIIKKDNNIHTLNDYDFIQKIMEFGGTPKEIINSKELLELVIPILRNDFKIIENYNFKEKNIRLNVMFQFCMANEIL